MKLGILSWILDRQRTGIDNYLYSIILEMIEAGHANEISLIHYKKTDDLIYEQVNDIIIPSLPFKLTTPLGMAKAIKNEGIEIFHLPSHWHTQISPFFLNSTVKKIITVHDIIPLLFRNNLPSEYKYWGPTLRLIKNRTDCIITDSENTKKDCIKYLNIPEEKIEVIYLAADKRYKYLENKQELKDELRFKYNINDLFILYVGTVESRKNVSLLIKSFHELKKLGVKHKLVLIGVHGHGSAKIVELVSSLNLVDDVIFTGYVPDNDLVKFYNTADIFIYPSLYEGFGLTPLEAMACGCPVISSNTSSLPEVIGEAGVLVDPYDYKVLAGEIYRVLIDEDLRKELSKKSLQRSKVFNWKKTAKKTWNVYEKVLEGKK
jgi:glycosyltransferase involved in cell wall biosynthesis